MLLLEAGPQVRGRRRGQPTVELVEAATRADGRERGRERALRLLRVVHVVRGDALDVRSRRDLDERVVAGGVERITVIPQLDEHVVLPEQCDEIGERSPCRRRTVTNERGGNRALAATGEHDPVVVVQLRQLGQRVERACPSRVRATAPH